MKRPLRTLLLTVAMILTISTLTPAAGAVNATDAWQMCYDTLYTSIAERGLLPPSSVDASDGMPFPDAEGVYFAQALDMDRDGLPELITMDARYKTERLSEYSTLILESHPLYMSIYTFSSGKPVRVLDKEVGIAKGGYGLCVASDGRTYLKVSFETGIYNYYSVANGALKHEEFLTAWVPEYSYSGIINGEHYYVSGGGSVSAGSFINSNAVSDGEFARRRAAMEVRTIASYNFYSEKTPDNGVQNTLNAISAKVPATFLQCYTTPSSWAAEAVAEGISMNIVPKHLQKMYNQPITREEFCELAAKYYEISTGKSVTTLADFNDTTSEAVRKMGGLGIITGTGGGNFSPDALLTREQAAVILVRLGEVLGGALPESAPVFADNAQISTWASAQVGKVQAAGIMSGTSGGNFSPKAAYTREQSVLTMMRMSTASQPEATRVKMDDSTVTVLPAGSVTLGVTAYNKSEKINQVFTWKSSNPAVASVDPYSGKVTAHTAGKATITASAANGESDKCTVTVPELISGLYFLEDEVFDAEILMDSGDTQSMLVEVSEIKESFSLSNSASIVMQLTYLETVGDYDEDTVDKFLLHWEVCDAAGNTLDSGTESDYASKVGIAKEGNSIRMYITAELPKGYEGPFWLKLG